MPADRHRRRRLFKVTARGAAWAALLTGTSAMVVCSGIAAGLRDRQPALALHFWPDARAKAAEANRLLLGEGGDPVAVREADRLARAALARDATLANAWRTVALAAPAGSPLATKALATAETLSRRDIPTQLALIEQKVQRNDVPGALRHYDIVLRVSAAYDPLLFPVLAEASTDPELRGPIAARLDDAPIWRRRFLSYLVGSSVPVERQVELFATLKPLRDGDIVAALATRTALGGNYAAAFRLYALVDPAAARLPLRNADFERADGVAPFDWQIDADGPIDGAIAPAEGGRRLEMMSRRGDGGRAARQLLAMSPGAYTLGVRYGTIDGEGQGTPRVTMVCAGSNAPLATFMGAQGQLGGRVVVPADCRWQWIELGLEQSPSDSPMGMWMSRVSLTPAGR